MSSEYDEKHLRLMSFASAPLSSSSILSELDDVDPSDLTPEILIDEIELLGRFAEQGLSTFATILRQSLSDSGSGSNDSDLDKNTVILPAGKPEHKAAVSRLLASYLLPFFLQRLSKFAHGVERVADNCRKVHFGEMSTDTTDELRRLISMVNKGDRPSEKRLSDTLDLTKGLKWEVPDLRLSHSNSNSSRGVGFNSITQERGESRGTIEAPLKSGTQQFNRRKARNPTGYAKFNFTDLDLDEDEQSEISIKAPEKAESESDGPPEGGMKLKKMHSSIDESAVEIQDEQADPNWHDDQRKKQREVRVRRRIPTGHPNMLNSALLARASLEGGAAFEDDDGQTRTNTEANT